MTSRRDLIIGAACILGAGAAYQLKPRREVLLLPKDAKLEDLVPLQMPGWTGQDVGDPLALNQEGTLAARLYNQQVVRLYTGADGVEVMMLLAYGAKQSDDLQLHRPEICYPAFGFTLVRNEPTKIPLMTGVDIPARRLIARKDDGVEYVTYWSRLGEYLPQDGGEQRTARFENAFHGLIPDGVLCRFSTWADNPTTAFSNVNRFVQALVLGMKSDRRSVLIGRERAARLGSRPV